MDLVPDQVATMNRLQAAGFDCATLAGVEGYLAVEKDGFAALLEPIEGSFRIFGQIGYRMGESLGTLVEQEGRQVFVYQEKVVDATPEMIETYQHFRAELQSLLEEGREQ